MFWQFMGKRSPVEIAGLLERLRQFSVDCLWHVEDGFEEKDRYFTMRCSSFRHLQDLLVMPKSEISPGNCSTLRLLEDVLGIPDLEFSLGMPHFGGEAQIPKITDFLGNPALHSPKADNAFATSNRTSRNVRMVFPVLTGLTVLLLCPDRPNRTGMPHRTSRESIYNKSISAKLVG